MIQLSYLVDTRFVSFKVQAQSVLHTKLLKIESESARYLTVVVVPYIRISFRKMKLWPEKSQKSSGLGFNS